MLKLLALVLRRWNERQIEQRFGSPVALRAIFGGMARSFEPDAAGGFERDLDELTRLATGQEPAIWTIEISGRRAKARPGPSENAKLTLRLHLPTGRRARSDDSDAPGPRQRAWLAGPRDPRARDVRGAALAVVAPSACAG